MQEEAILRDSLHDSEESQPLLSLSRATTNAEDISNGGTKSTTAQLKKDKDGFEEEAITPGGEAELTPPDDKDSVLVGGKPEPKQIMFIKVKKETTGANLAALLVIPSISVAASAYINANMPYLLQSPDHFNIPFS